MNVRYRRMQLKDVVKFVEHLAAHPVLGPRYGSLIEDLPSALNRALGRDSMAAVVFEEFQGSTIRFIGAGIAVFVSDNFLREVKTTPLFWIGPELVKRIGRGKSPLLSDTEVRDANSTAGLNLVVWQDSSYPEDMRRAEVGTVTMVAFEESYRGFRLREIIAHADCLEHLLIMRNAGGLYFDRAKGRYGKFPEVSAKDFSDEPRNVGMPRDLALTHGASWVGSLFLYAPPQFGFSRAEQRLLGAALAGGTDEELSDGLGVSLFSVKKTWRMIYDRVAQCMPELVPGNARGDAETQGRGKQKKQTLLAYLREHPEELRPVSRKLLRQHAARERSLSKSESVPEADA
jgi:hypothetical protein